MGSAPGRPRQVDAEIVGRPAHERAGVGQRLAAGGRRPDRGLRGGRLARELPGPFVGTGSRLARRQSRSRLGRRSAVRGRGGQFPAAGNSSAAGGCWAAGAAWAAGGAASSSAFSISRVSSSEPSETRSPSCTDISEITPASGDGISIVALSLSSVTRESSGATRSPFATSTSMTSTSSKSPMSGTRTWMDRAKASSESRYRVAGLGFSGSMPYLRIASTTRERSIAPSSDRAHSAAVQT